MYSDGVALQQYRISECITRIVLYRHQVQTLSRRGNAGTCPIFTLQYLLRPSRWIFEFTDTHEHTGQIAHHMMQKPVRANVDHDQSAVTYYAKVSNFTHRIFCLAGQRSIAGEVVLTPQVGRSLLHVFDGAGPHLPGAATHLGFIAGEPLELTGLEYKLLAYMVEHRGKVLSRDELLDKVWGYDVFPTTRTVDNHIVKLRKQVEDVPSEPKIITSVRGVGYKFNAEVEGR